MTRMLPGLALLLLLAPAVQAAPPPAPPEYVYHARQILTAAGGADVVTLAPLFADDLTISENGKTLASGKDAGVKLLAASMRGKARRVVLYSEGDGDLMVVDTWDTVDRANLPPTFIADPRMAARSTLYQFGDDQRIHAVRIMSATGFWAVPRN